MCGRFTLRSDPRRVAQEFGLADAPELAPRFNVAPTQQVGTVRRDAASGQRQLVFLHWGPVPSWADDPGIGNRMINARGETVAEKPSFRRAFRARRCLVVADGFYEWKKTADGKQPFYITLADEGPFGMAGLWEHWQRDAAAIDSCTIITITANQLMAKLHDRMPVIIEPDQYDFWLDERIDDPAELSKLLRPYPAEQMKARPVSKLVNNPRNDRPECVEPVRDDEG